MAQKRGRPPLSPDGRRKLMNISVPPEMHARLVDLAFEAKQSLSAFVRSILEKELARRENQRKRR